MQRRVAPSIVSGVGVLSAVDLDDETPLMTYEVRRVSEDGLLASELVPAKSLCAELLPQHLL